MSRKNKDGVFVDVGLLRDHISRLREERRLAIRLYDSVSAMRHLGDPESYGQYASVLKDIDQLIEYFERMVRVLDEADTEAVQMSHETGMRIEHDTHEIRHASSCAFML